MSWIEQHDGIDIAAEMHAMEHLLKVVSKEATNLANLDDPSPTRNNSKKSRKLSEPQSWWGKSKVPSAASVTARKGVSDRLETNAILDSEKVLHTRVPAFPFGRRPNSNRQQGATRGSSPGPNPLTYHVNDNGLSTRKRSYITTFNKSGSNTQSYNQQSHPETADNKMDDEPDRIATDYYETEEPIPAGYSFGKSKRFDDITQDNNNNKAEDEGMSSGGGYMDLDVEKADRARRPNSSSVRMVRPAPPPSQPESDEMMIMDIDAILNPNVDVQSHRPRTPSIRFGGGESTKNSKTPSKQQRLAAAGIVSQDAAALGPGYYEVKSSALAFTHKGAGVTIGQVFTSPTRRSSSRIRKTQHDDKESTAHLGPGCYNPSIITSKASVGKLVDYASSAKTSAMADTKTKDALLRKRYLEQKAQDLREVHEDQRTVVDTLVRPQTPTFSFAHAPLQFSDDKAERIRQVKVKVIEPVYNVRYSQVETRVSGVIDMKRPPHPNTKQKLMSNNIRKNDDEDRRFYGPQVPVPWVPDKASMAKVKGDRDESNSPTAEVLRLLDSSSNRTGGSNKQGEEYLEAFRQSRYGRPVSTPAVTMYPVANNKPRYAVAEDDLEYIGPQLPIDWTNADQSSNNARFKSPSIISLDRATGREKKKILGKGLVTIEGFDEHHIEKDTSALGPGHYNIEAVKPVAKGVMSFDKVPGRSEVVGPYGQRPQEAVEQLSDDEADHVQLDIDYGNAKDQLHGIKTKKGVTLYAKDRYPVEKPPGPGTQARIDHLGGSWFEGMAETAVKGNKGIVAFDKMKGRSILDLEHEDAADDDLIRELGIPINEHLDLEVKDHQPHKAGANPKVQEFTNPKQYPRFPVAKPKNDMPELDVKYTTQWTKEAVHVDMNKMQGRSILDEHDQAEEYLTEINGRIPDKQALALGEEQAGHVISAVDYLKTRQGKGGVISFSKQLHGRGLEDDQEAGNALVEQAVNNLTRPGFHTKDDINNNHLKPLAKAKGGALDWNKVNNGNHDQHALLLQDDPDFLNGQDRVLDLQPHREGTSKHKRTITAPGWDTQASRFENTTAVDQVLHGSLALDANDGTNLVLKDVDAGLVKKKGLGGFLGRDQIDKNKLRALPNMSNIPGRNDAAGGSNKQEVEIEKEFGIATKPEVDIKPSDETLQRRQKQSTGMQSKASRFADNANNTTAATAKEETSVEQSHGKHLQQSLKLDPSDEAIKQKLKGGGASSMRSTSAARLGNNDDQDNKAMATGSMGGLQAISRPGNELKLDVKDDTLRRSIPNNPAMRSSATRFPDRLGERALEHEEKGLAQPGKLQLDVNDEAMRTRTPSAASLGRSERLQPSNTLTKAMKDLKLNEQPPELELDLSQKNVNKAAQQLESMSPPKISAPKPAGPAPPQQGRSRATASVKASSGKVGSTATSASKRKLSSI